jgi:tetratricopeptide (TPR) repeat protein
MHKAFVFFLLFQFLLYYSGFGQVNNSDKYLKQAQKSDSLKNYEEAINLYTMALEEDPNSSKAYLGRANDYYFTGIYEIALQDFDKTIELDPNNFLSYQGRALTKKKLKYEHEDVLADFNKAISLNPENFELYLNRGTFYDMIGNLIPALRDFNKSIELKSDFYLTYSKRSFIRRHLGDEKGACSDIVKATHLGEKYAEHYLAKCDTNIKNIHISVRKMIGEWKLDSGVFVTNNIKTSNNKTMKYIWDLRKDGTYTIFLDHVLHQQGEYVLIDNALFMQSSDSKIVSIFYSIKTIKKKRMIAEYPITSTKTLQMYGLSYFSK